MLMPMASYTYERIKPLNDSNDIERHLDALYNLTELADASKILLGAQYRSKGGLHVNRYFYSYQQCWNRNVAKVPFYVLCIFIRANCRTSLINKRFIIWPKWNDCLVRSKFRAVKVESKFNAWFCLLADQNKIRSILLTHAGQNASVSKKRAWITRLLHLYSSTSLVIWKLPLGLW